MTELIILALFLTVVSALFKMKYDREMRKNKLDRIQRELERREANERAPDTEN